MIMIMFCLSDASEESTEWVWQWKSDLGDWRLYEEQWNDRLEKEYKRRQTGSCIVQRDGNT